MHYKKQSLQRQQEHLCEQISQHFCHNFREGKKKKNRIKHINTIVMSARLLGLLKMITRYEWFHLEQFSLRNRTKPNENSSNGIESNPFEIERIWTYRRNLYKWKFVWNLSNQVETNRSHRNDSISIPFCHLRDHSYLDLDDWNFLRTVFSFPSLVFFFFAIFHFWEEHFSNVFFFILFSLSLIAL